MTEDEVREEFNDEEFVNWVLARSLYMDPGFMKTLGIQRVYVVLNLLALAFNAGRQAESDGRSRVPSSPSRARGRASRTG